MSLHTLVITITDERTVAYRIECPHTGVHRPCAVWEQNADDHSCACECEACIEGAHDDCTSDGVEEIGRKWCECQPIDQCWHQHALETVGDEMLDFGLDGITVRVPVELSGGSWDEPIDVAAVSP